MEVQVGGEVEEPAEAVASPCIGVCKLDQKSGLCLGCLRDGREIGAWKNADTHLRRAILDRIAARRAAGLGAASPLPAASDQA